MKLRPMTIAASIFLAAFDAIAAERWVPFDVVSVQDVDLSELSPIGKRVLSKTDEWIIGRSRHFTVFAYSRPELSRVIDDAEHTRRRITEWLDLDMGEVGGNLLVFINDKNMWSRIVRGHGLRPDSLAMQLSREIYFKNDAVQQQRPDRIAHEVIHLCLARVYTNGIPLWLDEGLASHYGWMCSKEVNASREIVLSKQRPEFREEEIMPLEQLLSLRKYPDDPAHIRAFYRQSEELVAVLEGRIGQDEMARFVKVMCNTDGNAMDVFRSATKWQDSDMVSVIEEMRRRCLSPGIP